MFGKKSHNPYYSGPRSDHFDGERFFNPGGVIPSGFSSVLKWRLQERPEKWAGELKSPFDPAKPVTRVGGERLRITMVGHASLLIQAGQFNILTDPVWSDRVSPVRFAGPKRANEPGIRFEDLPPLDVVIVSHNHYDHLDTGTLRRIVRAQNPLIVTPLGNDRIIAKSVPGARIATMDWGDHLEYMPGLSLQAEPCHHWSARGTRDRRMALWAAFVLNTPAGRIYHVGDTGFHDGINYRAAAGKYGGFRLAVLPFGAYEPRWMMRGQHQNPEEAVKGMLLSNSAYVAGHHWYTFQLTNEPHHQPKEHLEAALDAAGVARERFRPMHPGEVFDVPQV